MKNRPVRDFSLELFRKAVHALTGVAIVLLLQAGYLTPALLGLLTVVCGLVVLFNVKYEREALTRILSINRVDARIPGLEIVSYLLGCTIVAWLFPLHIAAASIMILAFGDPIAHIISTGFGGTRAIVTRDSYLFGILLGTIVGAFAAWLYVPFLIALLAAAAAMVVEAGEMRIADHHVDDNLTIPLVAGAVLWVISLAFPF